MATGWAVGSAFALGASVALLLLGVGVGLSPDSEHPLQLLGVAVLYAAWAYGIAMAAYGAKGALVALLVHALAWCAVPAVFVLASRPEAVTLVVAAFALISGIGASWGIVGELRARRGAIQWLTALWLCIPLAVLALVALGARLT